MKNRLTGVTRRTMLFSSAAALGVQLLLPRRSSQAAAPSEPRFLLNLVGVGGLDASMMFDARPLAMTAAGKIHNPLDQQPMVWTGDNGQTALTHSTAAPLHPLRDKFSVINGVVMSTSFDGHDQNSNLLLAGNPFGGVSVNAIINHSGATPLDYIRVGEEDVLTYTTLQDTRNVLLTASGLKELVGGVTSLSAIPSGVDRYLAAESAGLGDPYDRYGAGVIALDAATQESQTLAGRLAAVSLGDDTDPLESQLALIRETFRLGIARGAMFLISNYVFDTHAPNRAKTQAPAYLALSERLARVFRFLADTPYDATRSLLDVTTVVYAAEFGRTMRQTNRKITNTGTDHNPLANSFLIGGAGIKSGLVIGASDFQTADEPLSGAHAALDLDNVKTMGKPFDFAAGVPRSDLPPTFVASDYLQVASVVNTIYALFGVDPSLWRRVEQGGANAPILSSLIK